MKVKLVLVSILFFLIMTGTSFSKPDQIKYFRIDKIISVSGKIMTVVMKDSYRKNKFIVFKLRDAKSEKFYDIEVSPQWFYNLEIVEGSVVDVKGSLNIMKDRRIILAQSIIFEGEVYNFRDKHGFPLWRGKRHGMNRGKWKGEMRRKGKR